jgi:hypothetical protein
MKNYWKAAAGFLAAAIVAYLGATDGGVTQQEWLTIVLAGLGGSGLVYIAPKNIPKPGGRHQAGNVDVGLLLLVTILVFVLLLFFRVHA